MESANLYSPDGSILEVYPQDGFEFHETELKKILETDDIVTEKLEAAGKDTIWFITDNTAIMNGKEENPLASKLWYQYTGNKASFSGDVLICPPDLFGNKGIEDMYDDPMGTW